MTNSNQPATQEKILERIADIRDRMQKSKDWPFMAGFINDLTELEAALAAQPIEAKGKQGGEPIAVRADIVRNEHAGYMHMRVKNGETGENYDFILPEWAVTQSLAAGQAAGSGPASAPSGKPHLSQATEFLIRMFLWQGHGHEGIYGDDGEMQCGQCGVDYKRDSLDVLVEKARVAALETGLKRLAASPATVGLSAQQLRDEWYAVHQSTGLNYLTTPWLQWFTAYAERLNTLLRSQPAGAKGSK